MEIEIKASKRAIRRWLVSIINDECMPKEDRWFARQTLEAFNESQK